MTLEDARPATPLTRRLTLRDFRSYAALDTRFNSKLVALTGENGAGKTNILEALSMFSPGRGLRRAEIGLCARHHGPGGFAVSIEIETSGELTQLGHGFEPASQDGAARRFRIDRTPVVSARAFADHIHVLWLTPAMDGLFTGPAGDRRRFLDRLTLGVDADHGARVAKLERALRNRNRLLEEAGPIRAGWPPPNRKSSSLGVAVASARLDTVQRLSALIEAGRDETSPFPFAQIELAGELERMLLAEPAFTVEERYRALLADSRRRDAAAGRTLIGPQASDLLVRHGPKGEAAQDCSTGRTESPAYRARAGPCPACKRHERHRAAAAAGRNLRAFRRAPTRGLVRRTDPDRRPGLDDRRRSVVVRLTQGRADIFTVTPGRIDPR